MASINLSSLFGYFKPQLPCPNGKLIAERIPTHTIRELKIQVKNASKYSETDRAEIAKFANLLLINGLAV